MKYPLRSWGLLTLVSLFVVLLTGGSSLAASSANVSRSYSTTTAIKPGSIVSLDKSRPDYVVPANTGNSGQTVGVAVKDNESLIAVDPGLSKVQIATSGDVTTLVSTINGSIKVGDHVAISPFDGIGMESGPGEHVIGIARTAFTGTSSSTLSKQVTDKNGKTQTIKVGYVQLNIAVGIDSSGDDANATGLQKLVRSLTGHRVSTPRIIISVVIVVCTLLALIVLIYSAIYGSIISIGRNPLARDSIFGALWRVLWMAGLMVVVALALVYMLLR